MATRTTRSRQGARRANLSPEVAWYLESRGYEAPRTHPLFKTPEPTNVKGAIFSPERVDRVIRAIGSLRHTKGRWAGTPLVLDSVQVAYEIAPVFGWVVPSENPERGDGYRRIIQEAYFEMPRKGAKTTLGGGIAFYLAFADGEEGAEVILGAASREQAGMAFGPLRQLTMSSPLLGRAGIKATRAAITQDRTGSFIKVVSSRGELTHGANVHGGLVDELHVHRNPDLLEAIESGSGAREQPLTVIITTADDGQTDSVYAKKRSFIERLATGVLKAPSVYGVIFSALESEDPFSEATWAAANPLYPVTPSKEFMLKAADKAKADPAAMASFLRLHLGVRSKLDAQYLDMAKWRANSGLHNEPRLAGQIAYGGLDLASVSDITALAWLVKDPADDEVWNALWRFWIPEAALSALDKSTARTASGWVKDGWITLTPGTVTNYDWIKKQIQMDMQRFEVAAIGYDKWNATQLVLDLEEEDVPMVRVNQTVGSLSGPLKEINRLVLLGTEKRPMLVNGGNPVARWMADNLRVYQDPNGNIKPDKARSTEKIDGISALTNAMSVALAVEPQGVSAYADHDLIVV